MVRGWLLRVWFEAPVFLIAMFVSLVVQLSLQQHVPLPSPHSVSPSVPIVRLSLPTVFLVPPTVFGGWTPWLHDLGGLVPTVGGAAPDLSHGHARVSACQLRALGGVTPDLWRVSLARCE